jgi:hypothetical protein
MEAPAAHHSQRQAHDSPTTLPRSLDCLGQDECGVSWLIDRRESVCDTSRAPARARSAAFLVTFLRRVHGAIDARRAKLFT